jgi:hypothetical protein
MLSAFVSAKYASKQVRDRLRAAADEVEIRNLPRAA